MRNLFKTMFKLDGGSLLKFKKAHKIMDALLCESHYANNCIFCTILN